MWDFLNFLGNLMLGGFLALNALRFRDWLANQRFEREWRRGARLPGTHPDYDDE